METDYWLGHCEGFRLDSPVGRVGTVESVVYEEAIDRPSALLDERRDDAPEDGRRSDISLDLERSRR